MRPFENRPIAGAGAGAGTGAGETAFESTLFPDCDLPDEATSEKFTVMEATQAVILEGICDIRERLSKLQESSEQNRRRSSDDSPASERPALVEHSAIRKLLDQYTKDLSHKLQDLHYYIRPGVLSELPGNLTVGEYVFEVEAGKRVDASTGLLAEVDKYLVSDDQVLLLLGEPGAGKSLFAWYSTQVRLAQYRQVLQGEDPGVTPWLPVVIDLKNYTLSELIELLPSYLKEVCQLNDGEVRAIQHDRKPQHKLLVVLDGFDELKQPAAGELDIRKSFADCFAACGSKDWYAGQIKLVVTCRFRHLTDRYLERQYFGHGVEQRYRRRILLPFSSAKIAAYLHGRAARADGSREGVLKAADYIEVLEQSKSVKEMVRNPFVLRLFVEALPRLRKDVLASREISRFDIYQGFVSQWFEREVKRLDVACQRGLGVDKLGIPAVAKSFERYASILAMEMYRQDTLVVGYDEAKPEDSAFQVWSRLDELVTASDLDEADIKASLSEDYRSLTASAKRGLEIKERIKSEEEYIIKYLDQALVDALDRLQAQLEVFKITSPLRQLGEHYSFVHKSFYEYFIAKGIRDIAGSTKPLEARVHEVLASFAPRPGHESRRLWQEPEVLEFVCEYWAQAGREEKDRLKATWFAVIEATKGHPEHGVAGANVGTLLNWVNASLTYKGWRGVQMPGVDLRQAYLEGSDMREANLNGAWLGKIQANNVDLRGAILEGTEFSERPAVKLENSCYALACHPRKPIVAVAAGHMVRQYNFAENRWVEPAFLGHSDIVRSLSYSPDGKWLASGSNDNTIRQWLAETGELRVAPLKGHDNSVTSVSYSPDGQWLASGSQDKTTRQWRAETGESRGAPLVGHTRSVNCVRYSPDGKWLASGSVGWTIWQWDTESGRMRRAPLGGPRYPVNSLSYSPDGKWLAGGTNGAKIWQWDAESGELRGAPLIGHTDSVTSICYSPDGQWLASGSWDESIRQWDVESGELRGVPLVGHTRVVASVSYSGDGIRLVSGSWDESIRQWDAASGELRAAPQLSHTDQVMDVKYSGDNRWVASVSRDKTVRQWDAETGEPRGAPLIGHTGEVYGVSYRGQGNWLASGSQDQTIRQWDAKSGELHGAPLVGHTEYVASISYSPDGKWLASGGGRGDNTVRQWCAETGRPFGEPLTGHGKCVNSLSYSSDGKWLASGSQDATVRQWDVVNGKQRGKAFYGHKCDVESVCYSPDGKWLASGGEDAIILQWDAETGKLRGVPLTGHARGVTSVSYSPDGRYLVSGGNDDCILHWDARAGVLARKIAVGHAGRVTSLSFSTDGLRLVAACEDRTIRQWVRYIEPSIAVVAGEAGSAVGVGAGVSGEDYSGGDSCETWRLAWGTKSSPMQLSAKGMKLAGASGLESHQLELLRQHGYESGDEYVSDGCAEGGALAAGVEESKTAPREEAETEGGVGLGVGQQVVRAGLFAASPGADVSLRESDRPTTPVDSGSEGFDGPTSSCG